MRRRLILACAVFLMVPLLLHLSHRAVSAQVSCATLQKQIGDLKLQIEDAQSALADSERCSGKQRAAVCVQNLAVLKQRLAGLQKTADSLKCTPDPNTPPQTLPLCCGWRVERNPRLASDLNADGKADVVAFGDDGVFSASSNGSGGFADPAFGLSNMGYNEGWRVDKHVRLLADITGDKRPDIVGFNDAGVWTAIAAPSGGFQPAVLTLQNFGGNQSWDSTKHVRLVGDINGDGRADIVGFGDAGVWTALSTGGGGFTAPVLAIGNLGYNQGWRVDKHVRMLADVNGDGRQDIVAFGDDGVWLALANADGSFGPAKFVLQNFGLHQAWDPAKHVRLMGDINGDGKADIVGFGDAGVWVALSTGTGFAAPTLVIPDLGYNQGWRVERHVRLLADVNGDGRKDLVAFGDDGVWIALANASGGFAPASFVVQNFGSKQGWDPAKHVRTMADINGDGRADIVAIGDDGVWTALSTGGAFAAPGFVLADFGYGGAMDVVSSADFRDDNGFLRNPVWRSTNPYPCGPCPCSSGKTTPQNWKGTTGCTIQTLHTNTFAPCGLKSISGLNGLMNYFPVEYEGTIAWGGHSSPTWDDDDYYFTISRPDRALQTYARDGVHFEFDSEETVDHWDSTHTWWDDFHHNAVDKDDATAHSYVDGKQAIVIGMVGLDMAHNDFHSELHPAYAVFVRMPGPTANQEKVAFFVRNWGNQGFCGRDQEPIPQNTLKVRLRHPSGPGFTLAQNIFVYTDKELDFQAPKWSSQRVSDGLLLTFTLPDASKKDGFEGDFTINWGAPEAAPPPHTVAASPSEEEVGNPAVKAQVSRLSPADRLLLYQGLKNLRRSVPAQPIAGTAGSGGEPTPPIRTVVQTATDYGATLKSVEDPARATEKAAQSQFIASFLKAHGIS